MMLFLSIVVLGHESVSFRTLGWSKTELSMCGVSCAFRSVAGESNR